MKTDTRKVVSVMSFNSVMEAQLYKALLESAGIQTRMQNDLAAQVMPAFGALMQVNLLVAEEDQRKAREIIGAKFDIDEFQRQSSISKKEPTGTELANEARKAKIAEKKATKTAVAESTKVSRKAGATVPKKTPAPTARKRSASIKTNVEQGIVAKKTAPKTTAKKTESAEKPIRKKSATTKSEPRATTDK